MINAVSPNKIAFKSTQQMSAEQHNAMMDAYIQRTKHGAISGAITYPAVDMIIGGRRNGLGKSAVRGAIDIAGMRNLSHAYRTHRYNKKAGFKDDAITKKVLNNGKFGAAVGGLGTAAFIIHNEAFHAKQKIVDFSKNFIKTATKNQKIRAAVALPVMAAIGAFSGAIGWVGTVSMIDMAFHKKQK